ncbi:MAG: hypothetical protein ABIG94_10910 [Pseudomonadota bacterium]
MVVAPVGARGHGCPQGGAALSLMVYTTMALARWCGGPGRRQGGRGCADGRVGPWTLERWTVVVVAVAARVGPGAGCCVGGAGAGSLALGQGSVVDGCRSRGARRRSPRGRDGWDWPGRPGGKVVLEAENEHG